MKASRRDKLEVQLADAERTLLDLLADALPYTAQHGDLLFFNSGFHPDHGRPHSPAARNERLLSLAREAVSLRERTGLPVPGSVGQLFLSACSEAADTTDGHRRGPRQLAAWLLDALGPDPAFASLQRRGTA